MTDDPKIGADMSGDTVRRLRERIELQHRLIEAYERARRRVERAEAGQGGGQSVVAVLPGTTARRRHRAAAPPGIVPPMPGTLPDRPLKPMPGYSCFSLGGTPVQTALVLVFGLDREALEGMVAMVGVLQARTRNFAPVFCTDFPDLGPFRAGGFVVEYFPRSTYRRPQDAGLDRDRVKARTTFLARKWAAATSIDLSATADRAVTAGLDLIPAGGGTAIAISPVAAG